MDLLFFHSRPLAIRRDHIDGCNPKLAGPTSQSARNRRIVVDANKFLIIKNSHLGQTQVIADVVRHISEISVTG